MTPPTRSPSSGPPIVTWGRLLYLLLITPLVLILAAIGTLLAPGSLNISYATNVIRGDTASTVVVFCLSHSWSGAAVDAVTIAHDSTWTRVYPPDLTCADTEPSGLSDLATLGPLTPDLLATRLGNPGSPSTISLAQALDPWIREIAQRGPDAMARPPFPAPDFTATMDPIAWYAEAEWPAERFSIRAQAGKWFVTFLAIGAFLEMSGFILLTRRSRRTLGPLQELGSTQP